MKNMIRGLTLLTCLLASFAAPAQQGDAKKGAYLAKAGGCVACHTASGKDAAPFAGGHALKTPFGTFYGPNITPHAEAGLGKWSEADFRRALRQGERPDGAHYFPAFPYPSYTSMSDADVGDLWAYLRSLPPNPRANQAHDLRFPFGWRFLMTGWKLFFFTPGAFTPDAKQSVVVNRGAYLVQALSHCSECHSPRNFMGGIKKDRLLGGAKEGPNGKSVPNITPTRLKKWSDKDLQEFLISGLLPDGDVTAEAMGEVVRNTTSQLTPEDLAAMIAYLRTIPAVADEPK